MKTLIVAIFGAATILLAGCAGMSAGEKAARQRRQTVENVFRPDARRPPLPVLTAHTPLSDFLLFAMLNRPRIEAAYYDYTAAVERIAVERSLPDPRFTFESEIAGAVMSLMPGLMTDFPGAGKRDAAARIATAESDAKYFVFETQVLQTAADIKKAYYQLYFLDTRFEVNRRMLRLLTDVEMLARAQNEAGKATLQDVLRARIEQELLASEVVGLEDARHPLLAQFKAALGLFPDRPDPPTPEHFESTSLDLSSDEILRTALARNPRLKVMEAEIRRADAALRLAYRTRLPDAGVGLEVETVGGARAKPQFSLTLPFRREAIAARIAEAQAMRRAGEARLTDEQIGLAVEVAERSFLFREASRKLELLTTRLLPMAGQSLETARSGYVSGSVDFLNLLDAGRTLLDFRLAETEARVQRELALTELSLLVLGTLPAQTPMLPDDALPGKEIKP
ncbi:MAG: TolC family protein [candidate division Zixibacteria bacterium]|nr:TolC family protein [candidate division Zixibacteria bacterium]